MKKGKILSGVLLSFLLISCSHGQPSANASQEVSKPSPTQETKQPETQPSDSPKPESTVKQEDKSASVSAPTVAPAPKEGKGSTSSEPKETKQTIAEETSPAQSSAPVQAPAPPAESAPQAQEPQQTVTLSVMGDKERGAILSAQPVEIKQGETVLDVLSRVTKQQKIQMEYSGVKATAYVKGIDNLYEFDDGPKSGWMFKVNGKTSDRSAGAYSLKPGDRVEWLYTLDLGKDIGAK